jgi:hypothetical protein
VVDRQAGYERAARWIYRPLEGIAPRMAHTFEEFAE